MSTPPGRILVVIDDDPDRIASVAAVIEKDEARPRVLVLDAAGEIAAASALHEAYSGPSAVLPDVVLVRADPRGWTAAAVLAAHRPLRDAGRVEALVVAEGTNDTLPVLINDFPGLRRISPIEEVPSAVLARLRAGAAAPGPTGPGGHHGDGRPAGSARGVPVPAPVVDHQRAEFGLAHP